MKGNLVNYPRLANKRENNEQRFSMISYKKNPIESINIYDG